MKNVKIIVASHKPYTMPSDACYLPLHVGKNQNEGFGFQGDDTGDNISEKNPYYCELTGLYWAWKNLDVEYVGLAHYRRHFSMKSRLQQWIQGKEKCILRETELQKLLETTDIILPKRRNYVIESVEEHYCHTHYPEPLYETQKILTERYPDIAPAFEQVMKRKTAHMFNMYIMRKDLSDAYCTFLFDVLGELENRIDISGYSAFQARVYGRISELLLDVWILYKGYSYKEIPVMHMEKVNWIQKGYRVLHSKFTHEYYEG